MKSFNCLNFISNNVDVIWPEESGQSEAIEFPENMFLQKIDSSFSGTPTSLKTVHFYQCSHPGIFGHIKSKMTILAKI